MSMYRTPAKRKCRNCSRNFAPETMVIEHIGHDYRGYPVGPARWCLPCATDRLPMLASDPRCVEDHDRLAAAIAKLTKATAS